MAIFTYRADFPAEWPYANIYVFADEHDGDPHCDLAEMQKRLDDAEKDPYGLVILNGDLMNTALRHSVSDVYGEIASPMEQIARLVARLKPIAHKVIAATTGNHENRAYKESGLDIMRLVCRELGIEDRYCPEGVLVFLRFGQKKQYRHHDRKSLQWYTIYATHGSGGGRKEGAKAIRLADMASIVDADVYIHSHTHLPMTLKLAFYRADVCNCSAQLVTKLFVNTGASLEYGGYGQAQEFKPASTATPVIHLAGGEKCATATL